MRLFSSISFLLLHALTASANADVKPRRTTSLLIDPNPQPDLPPPLSPNDRIAADPNCPIDDTNMLNRTNIQGDILVGMKKNKELFYFFSIADPASFKTRLADLHPLITSTAALVDVNLQPTTAVNIAFSRVGLDALDINDDLEDDLFTSGQESDATALNDPSTTNWVSAFTGRQIHGVLIFASDLVSNVNDEVANVEGILGDSITEVYRLLGEDRSGAAGESQLGHEHFGYQDGIAQPAVQGFTTTLVPQQTCVQGGKIIVGAPGDKSRNVAWTKDGSFLAFRQLQQLVPEFNNFLDDNALEVEDLTKEEGAALLGARMVGRWKSGAPVVLTPLREDESLSGKDVNNNFDFSGIDESKCPFSAHIRKTRPRADLNPPDTNHHIMRAGIPYGPEVSDDEASSGTSDPSMERGLAFVAYQSDINQGFHFLQRTWANSPSFVQPNTGFDPIVGANKGASRPVFGLDPTDFGRNITMMTDFVVSRGGEYFFSPSISALLDTIAA